MEQGGRGVKPSETEIRCALDLIKDPCSVSVGVPLGLAEMGLVTSVLIEESGSVRVDIRLTSPGCMTGVFYFDQEIRRRLMAIAGVTAVSVGRTGDLSWSEADISGDGRQRLQEVRMRRLARS